jgi:hypothetical protein
MYATLDRYINLIQLNIFSYIFIVLSMLSIKNPIYCNGNQFVCKLPFTTNGRHNSTVKYCVGYDGILEMLTQFQNNANIGGYIMYAMIQPKIPDNTEAKIICFNGKAVFRNLNKKSSNGRSPFGGVKDEAIFHFAEHVISILRSVCPELITEQVLRVDIFGFRNRPGVYIVNEIEGYEAQRTAKGAKAGVKVGKLATDVEDYWYNVLCELVEYHINNNTTSSK